MTHRSRYRPLLLVVLFLSMIACNDTTDTRTITVVPSTAEIAERWLLQDCHVGETPDYIDTVADRQGLIEYFRAARLRGPSPEQRSRFLDNVERHYALVRHRLHTGDSSLVSDREHRRLVLGQQIAAGIERRYRNWIENYRAAADRALDLLGDTTRQQNRKG